MLTMASNSAIVVMENEEEMLCEKFNQHLNLNPIISFKQMNGCMIYGPPDGWNGSPPSSACELYIRGIPKNMCGLIFLEQFLRFGTIYEFRLPMDFNNGNRGYCYVKYISEEEALCAMEVMSHYYIEPGSKLDISQCIEKCSLFINNIPKHISEIEVEKKMRAIFPNMVRIYSRTSKPANVNSFGESGHHETTNVSTEKTTLSVFDIEKRRHSPPNSEFTIGNIRIVGNRGHAIAAFNSHEDALNAKKNITPGIIRVWGRDLKVVWANNEYNQQTTCNLSTLFVRNIEIGVNTRTLYDFLQMRIPRTEIERVTKVRNAAFFHFTLRSTAEKCMREFQGAKLEGKRLQIEWAKPTQKQSLYNMRTTDYDAILRLKCIANKWGLPIILFGTYFPDVQLQYAVVMLRDNDKAIRGIFCIMETQDLIDCHSRLCETVCTVIETIKSFPDHNYVFYVEKDNAHLLGMIAHTITAINFIASCNVPSQYSFDITEMGDLSSALANLSSYNEETILYMYQLSFNTDNICTYLPLTKAINNRTFGSVMPKYRNKPQLKFKLNDTQIVLVLCYNATGNNLSVEHRPYNPIHVSTFDISFNGLLYFAIKLLPIGVMQCRNSINTPLGFIQFADVQHHNHEVRTLSSTWNNSCTYNTSIWQPKSVQQLAPFQRNTNFVPEPVKPTTLKTPEIINYQSTHLQESFERNSLLHNRMPDVTSTRGYLWPQ